MTRMIALEHECPEGLQLIRRVTSGACRWYSRVSLYQTSACLLLQEKETLQRRGGTFFWLGNISAVPMARHFMSLGPAIQLPQVSVDVVDCA